MREKHFVIRSGCFCKSTVNMEERDEVKDGMETEAGTKPTTMNDDFGIEYIFVDLEDIFWHGLHSRISFSGLSDVPAFVLSDSFLLQGRPMQPDTWANDIMLASLPRVMQLICTTRHENSSN
ncbi:unnamed protein product [Linum trigynum]|uniref:Uncharacterized protein n=1 Tax=Linum trigynum TaxID=586398 RepID=A0AAV2DQT4_9ROSI